MYVHIFMGRVTWFVFHTHTNLPYIIFLKRANQFSFLSHSLPLSFFLREATVVPENILLYKTATIPIFIVIVYLYKSSVNNPYVLVGIFYPWHNADQPKYLHYKIYPNKTMHPRPNHHLDMNSGLSCIKAGKIKKVTGKFHIF